MIGQVQELRINVYEEKLSKQKAELQHLQLQINPHFFMNALNIIYNLAHVRNHELIQEMSMSLVQYFRYMFRSNLTLVPLKDEIRHIRNYMRIQELRFPGKLSFRLSMPEYLKDTRIPPLIIQTFIENSIKHAITPDASIDINVCMELEEVVDSEPLLKIRITDTGSGFSEEVLSEISKGNRIVDEHGEHIGIWNVKRRLGLLYGDAARLHISNHEPSGARVELVLPIQSSS
jgi:two-component system sensor histidine kinase YesM